MNKSILLFGGTTEGRLLAEFMLQKGINFTLFVATESGQEQSANIPTEHVLTGRLDANQMQDYVAKSCLVIDATHPYAQLVTENIKATCELCGVEYLRVLRSSSSKRVGEVVSVSSHEQAVDFLRETTGNILLAIGSKELAAYTKFPSFKSRIFVRMLPVALQIESCVQMGFKQANIIAMQGVFTQELNLALLKQIDARYLVTKDSGDEGGFSAKLEAAATLGIPSVVIERPTVEQGMSISQAKSLLAKCYLPQKIKPQLKHFPLFLDMIKVKATVVGGGKIATRRIKVLLDFGAEITVISPKISDELATLASQSCVIWLNRAYSDGDLHGAQVALAATNDKAANKAIAAEALDKKILCSVADNKDDGTFWFPAVAIGGDFVVGMVSESGEHSHVKAAIERIRKDLANEENS